MTCASCVNNIETALMSRKGVQKAVVALSTCKGYIEYDPSVIGPRDIIKTIQVSSRRHLKCLLWAAHSACWPVPPHPCDSVWVGLQCKHEYNQLSQQYIPHMHSYRIELHSGFPSIVTVYVAVIPHTPRVECTSNECPTCHLKYCVTFHYLLGWF